MMVTFVSQCEKKSLAKTRRVLDAFANRIGNNTWQTVITQEGLGAVKQVLRETASKNTAVSCHWIRSRSRSDFLWSVGNSNKFNDEGFVPVNYTGNNKILSQSNEGDWSFLPMIESFTMFAALLHDFGKLTVLFQDKLKGRNKEKSDPLRHEWVSVLFLAAIVGGKSDEEWLSSLITDEVHKGIADIEISNISNPLAKLPPAASMVAWLIISHHKLPLLEKHKSKGIQLPELFSLINSSWGYENIDLGKSFGEWFKYAELPSKSIEWQQEIKSCAIQLRNLLPDIHALFASKQLRPALTYARTSLMLADHYYSSQPSDPNWHSSVNLFANTDHHGGLKQQLDEHLVGVARQARLNVKKLPLIEAVFNQSVRVIGNQRLNKKSPADYKWQDDAVKGIESWKKNQEKLFDEHQFGFFTVNIASTGKGKTFANAKIMQSLSYNEESLRYILALGLRTLTLQTGQEYKDKIGLKDDELAVLIGSKAVSELHKQNQTGSESDMSLMDNELIFSSSFPEQGLDTVLKSQKDRCFLNAPVLTCTIDHIIQATEVKRGGRYILPTMRLMSSDLVIDEIDDFDGTDLIAIGRLIHLAGMLGRKVMISSATIPPDLAEGYFHAYESGWRIFADMRGKQRSVGCAWIDEFGTQVKSIDSKDDYKKSHSKFIDKRIENLSNQCAKRKVNIAECSTRVSEYFEAVKKAVLEKHHQHCFADDKTGKTISVGVVRMANIKPCIDLTRYLLSHDGSGDATIKAMAYHSRQVLLMRHSQERYLDKILKRHCGDEHILEDQCIRSHIDSSDTKHVVFILVATPVEEVGRDHDFDWAVIEPSSYRSFIQMAGRVLRHRDKAVMEPNIAIMKYNYRALDTGGKGIAFHRPGYQKSKHDLTTYDLNKLVDTKGLAERLDATYRIKRTQSSELADLEHSSIHSLLTNYDSKGPETMQGWIEGYWWLTGLPQQYIRFRGGNIDQTVFLSDKEGFLEASKHGGKSVSIGKECIRFDQEVFENLWFKRDYEALLHEQSKRLSVDTSELGLIYGEINLPTYGKPLKPNQFVYHEQLGLSKDV